MNTCSLHTQNSQATHYDDLYVLREDSNQVATLTLNRPKQFNALSSDMLGTLQGHLNDIAKDSGIQVVVIAAMGKAFCAGHNLKEMRATTDRAFYKALFDQCSQVMLTINSMPQEGIWGRESGHRSRPLPEVLLSYR